MALYEAAKKAVSDDRAARWQSIAQLREAWHGVLGGDMPVGF